MTQRRFDLDWLRITAFALLILYHCGMFYVTWSWHVKSSRASEAIEPLMMLTSPWRLSLLFLISGAATRFMADRMKTGAFLGNRMWRLFPPLLAGIFVIVPPQSYYEVAEALQGLVVTESTWLDNFYIKYVTGTGGWCDHEGCLLTPTYNHLWFVAYLIIYTLILVALFPVFRRVPWHRISWLISGPGLFLTPWLLLATARVTMVSTFGETHDFRDDWYLHTVYLSTFLFGFGIAKHEPFFEAAVRWRWLALGIAFVSWASLVAYFQLGPETPPDWLRSIFRAVREAEAWGAILAAIGFFHRHLALADGPLRRTLSVAVFPAYIIHQTIIVVAAYYLDDLHLSLWVEAPALIVVTAFGCWLFYEIGRRAGPLRVFFGLSSPARPNAAQMA